MLKIYNETNYIRLVSRSSEDIKKIRRHFTYKVVKWKNKRKIEYEKCLLVRNKYLLKGLLDELLDFLKSNKINYKIQKILLEKNTISDETIKKFLKKLKLKFQPRFYQINAIKSVIENKMNTILSKTGSGKSFIAYLMTMFYVMMKKNKKILIVVPSIQLVNQLYYDYEDYASSNEKLDIKKYIKRLSGKTKNKTIDKEKIIIANWQYLQHLPKSFFEQFGLLIFDEAHGGKAYKAQKIIKNCVNCDFKMGLTGTLPEDDQLKFKTVEGLLGKTIFSATSKELIELGFISDLKIYTSIINHGCIENEGYKEEINYILNSDKRNSFLLKLFNKMNGNTLVLFKTTEKPFQYGRMLYNISKKTNKEIMYIDGNVDEEERNRIQYEMEKKSNCILFASYGTLAVGVSIKRINNVIFAESMKSEIKVLQSIGRGLRLHDSKEFVKIFDIVDKFEYNSRYHENGYLYDHWLKRKEYYDNEEFNYKVKEFIL